MVQRIITYVLKVVLAIKNELWLSLNNSNDRRSIHSPVPTDNIPTKSSNDQRLRITSQKYDGKLLLRQEIHFNEQHLTRLIKKDYFTVYNGILNTMFTKQCLRCNNRDVSLFGYMPCEICHKTHIYCRNCIMMGRVSTCELLYRWTGPRYVWQKQNQSCTWNGTLTFAQQAASSAVETAIKDNDELLIWAVTGAGKTEILFKGIELALSKGKRVCIATPRADVVRELLPRVQQAFQSIHVQGLYGKSRDREGMSQLIIATTHQLIRFKDAFDVLIIDEIDAFPYHHDETLQFVTNRAAKSLSAKIYLTATPRQSYKNKIKLKRLKHCFVPIRYHGNPLPVPREVIDYTLSKRLKEYIPPVSFLTWLDNRLNCNRQLLIFVPTITLADQLTSSISKVLLQKNIIEVESAITHVHAEDPLREQKVLEFRHKKRYALITTTILERGVTFPAIDVVVIQANHQVFDEAALVQIAGRAGRSKSDPTGEVLFIHDGKTTAISQAISSIKKMNARGKKLLNRTEDKL